MSRSRSFHTKKRNEWRQSSVLCSTRLCLVCCVWLLFWFLFAHVFLFNLPSPAPPQQMCVEKTSPAPSPPTAQPSHAAGKRRRKLA